MVKAADNRLAKYNAKFDPTVHSARSTAIKTYAGIEFGVAAATYADLEARIKQLIENDVPSPILLPFYLSAARELQSKADRYGGLVLFNEAAVSKAKWIARGLDSDLIDVIVAAVGINVSQYGS